ncbi:unnamed protein product [Orchesella dallaii]|uniref:DNA repair protein complementing XP-G cells n=1 Tax=Orchesella dallaii TaxID=48710 RepID=A0ABP1RDM5_9HEXA
MGIHGLWQVLEPTGRPVNIHSLRGKVLAVDVSIWLHQLVKGFRDKDGNPLPNAHLLGVFHRVCKLLNSGVKPVFVFDGGVPVLKRQTLAARRQRKIDSLDKAESSRQKILSKFLQQQLQRQYKQALPPSIRMQAKIKALSLERSPSVSPKKKNVSCINDVEKGGGNSKDPYEIDEDLAAFRAALVSKLEDDVDEVNPKQEGSSDSDDDVQGYQYGVDYSENFSVIQAPEFDNLPLETQHEILFEMQESRKMNSWGKFDKMPKDLHSFSNFQMDRLVKRRTMQKKIQSVQQEMGQRHIHVQNLDELLKMDYSFTQKETTVIGSKSDGFVFIKTQEPKDSKEVKKEESSSSEPKPGTSSSAKAPQVITIDDYIDDSFSEEETEECRPSKKGVLVDNPPEKKSGVDEEDEDLKLAIELSLIEANKSDKNTHVVKPEISELSLAINKTINADNEEKNETKPEPARSANNDNHMSQIQLTQLSHCAKFLDTVGFHLPKSSLQVNDTNGIPDEKPQKEVSLKSVEATAESHFGVIKESESESDDDFEEVEMADEVVSVLTPTPSVPEEHTKPVAVIDIAAIKNSVPDHDIFADIFVDANVIEPEQIPPNTEENGKSRSESMHVEVLQANVNDISSFSKPEETSEIFNNPKSSTSYPEIDQWNSDSEIEADLLEMVAESTASFHPTSSVSVENSKIRSSEKLNSMASISSNSKTMSSEPAKRMITAEYMQAQDQLNTELEKLQSERGFQERVGISISDQMQVETQELISLFGIPYLISPTEAESQCAFLDKACLTEGSITDDSDVWLFGGQRVYKNFFSQGQKHIEFYQAADIQRVLHLNREKLIVLAMLVGSDYSDGIQGVGPVLGLEILSEFLSSDDDSFEMLIKFREWWEEIQHKKAEVFAGSKIKEKLRKLKLRPGMRKKVDDIHYFCVCCVSQLEFNKHEFKYYYL